MIVIFKSALRVATAALFAASFSPLAACAPASAPDGPPIAAVHTRRCGNCHTAPEPGSHTRASLEDAFGRHQRRVHLSQEEWQAMVDYLAVGTPPSQKN
jgi:Skp family chaperone for outer membrane proteins